MLDGSFWCNLTMKPVGKGFLAVCPNFELGNGSLYKSEPKVLTPKQEEWKIKRKEIKPIQPRIKPVISSKKTIPPQTRLF